MRAGTCAHVMLGGLPGSRSVQSNDGEFEGSHGMTSAVSISALMTCQLGGVLRDCRCLVLQPDNDLQLTLWCDPHKTGWDNSASATTVTFRCIHMYRFELKTVLVCRPGFRLSPNLRFVPGPYAADEFNMLMRVAIAALGVACGREQGGCSPSGARSIASLLAFGCERVRRLAFQHELARRLVREWSAVITTPSDAHPELKLWSLPVS